MYVLFPTDSLHEKRLSSIKESDNLITHKGAVICVGEGGKRLGRIAWIETLPRKLTSLSVKMSEGRS